MPSSATSQEDDLNFEELGLALRALGAFQIQLYDKLNNSPNDDVVKADIRTASTCIKKIHKKYERAENTRISKID